jgi:hypothetical protein
MQSAVLGQRHSPWNKLAFRFIFDGGDNNDQKSIDQTKTGRLDDLDLPYMYRLMRK